MRAGNGRFDHLATEPLAAMRPIHEQLFEIAGRVFLLAIAMKYDVGEPGEATRFVTGANRLPGLDGIKEAAQGSGASYAR